MFVKLFAVFFGLALVILAVGFVIRLLIGAKTNAEVKLLRERSNARARVEDDLLLRLDEVRPSKFSQRRADDKNNQ